MYRLTVYFHGPQTDWSDKIAQAEIVAQQTIPWLWLARARARSIMAQLNKGRCGYAISDELGEAVDVTPARCQVLTT